MTPAEEAGGREVLATSLEPVVRVAPAGAVGGGFWNWLASVDQTKLVVSFLGALAAVVTPMTTYISKSFELDLARVEQKQRLHLQAAEQAHKLKLQTGEQQQKFTADFLNWVLKIDKQGDSYFRRDVMSFFASALEDGRVKIWAQQELRRVSEEIGEVEKLRQDAAQDKQRMATLEAEAKGLRDAAETYRRKGDDSRTALNHAQKELVLKEQEVRRASSAAAASGAKFRDLQLAVNRHVEFHNPCPQGWLFTTSAAEVSRGLAACAFEAPPSPGTKVWRVKMDGEEFSCGCQPH